MKRLVILTLTLIFQLASIYALKSNVSASEQLKNQGDAYLTAGCYSDALEKYTEALDEAESEGDDEMYIRLLGQIGNIYVNTRDLERGIKYYLEGYDAAEKLGDENLQNKFCTTLVAAYCLSGDVEKAKLFYQQQLRLSMAEVNLKKYYLLYSQGRIAYTEKKYAMARYYFNEALQFAANHDLGAQEEFAQLLELANVDMSEKKSADALKLQRRALALAKEKLNLNMEAIAYNTMASSFELENEPDSAAYYRSLHTSIADSLFRHDQFYLANCKLFDHENNMNKKKISRLISRNNQLIIVIIFFVVLCGVIFFLLTKIRRRNLELTEAYQSLLSKSQELTKAEEEKRELKLEMTDVAERKIPNLDEETIKTLYEKIQEILGQPEHFMQPDFKVDTLSELVNSNQSYVSAVINYMYGKNFRQVLNEIRITEVCKRLQNGEYANVTLQAVAEQCGYKSSASFISAFKKQTGMTPSVYQRMIREKKPSDPEEPQDSLD